MVVVFVFLLLWVFLEGGFFVVVGFFLVEEEETIMVSSHTTTALRWRARMVKDAIQPELFGTADDSRIQLSLNHDYYDDDDDNNNNNKNMKNNSSMDTSFFFVHDDNDEDRKRHSQQQQSRGGVGSGPFLLPSHNRCPLFLLCIACLGKSSSWRGSSSWSSCWKGVMIRCMTLSSVLTTVWAAVEYGRVWYMAIYCTCTVTLCACIWYQLERFHILHNIRYQVKQSQQAHHRLSLQTEALWRQLERGEIQLNNLQGVAVDMEAITKRTGRSVQYLQRLVHEWKWIQQQMQQQLQQQVQQQILNIILDCDVDQNFVLSGTEWKRLQLRLQSLDGMELQFVDCDDDDKNVKKQQNNRNNNMILKDEDDEDENQQQEKKDKKEDDPYSTSSVGVIEVLRVLQQLPPQAQQQQEAIRKHHSSSSHHRRYYTPPLHRKLSWTRRNSTTTNQQQDDDDDDNNNKTKTTIYLTDRIRVQLDPQVLGRRRRRREQQHKQEQEQHTQQKQPPLQPRTGEASC